MTGVGLISVSLGILIGGRDVTADARGETTSGVATIKEREVGALFFLEVRQGKFERGVDVIPIGDVAGGERSSGATEETLLGLVALDSPCASRA